MMKEQKKESNLTFACFPCLRGNCDVTGFTETKVLARRPTLGKPSGGANTASRSATASFSLFFVRVGYKEMAVQPGSAKWKDE